RTSIRRSGQWESKPGSLGYGQYPAPRIRWRRYLFRRQVDSARRKFATKATTFAQPEPIYLASLGDGGSSPHWVTARWFGRARLWICCDVRFELWSDQIQLHHADVAAFAELQIRYLEHWRSFARVWAATGPL